MVIGSRQKLLAESHKEINIKLEDQVISNVDHAKSLGLIIDNRLSWSNHVNELCKKVTSAIGALRRIRPLISQSTAVLVSLIQPHFDYCSLVWDGLSNQLSDKSQKLQNRAARVILKANYETSSRLLLDILEWDKLVMRRKKHKAIMVFKFLNEQAPVYLLNLFHERSTYYDLRNSFHKLTLPKPCTKLLETKFQLQRCFVVELFTRKCERN